MKPGAAPSFWHFAAGHAEGLTGETHNASVKTVWA